MFERLRRNWKGAPQALRWWILSWMAMTLVLAILTLKITAVGRVFFTLLLFYHLLDKGKTASGLTVLFCLLAAGFSFWNASLVPFAFIPLGIYCLGFAGYLAFSPKYKSWINSIPATSPTE
jgi:succinate-acetate transporter protein